MLPDSEYTHLSLMIRIGGITTASLLAFIAGVGGGAPTAAAQTADGRGASSRPAGDVLTPQESRRVDESVDQALAWLAGRQQADGSFPSLDAGQPAVTALCGLAFLARGHVPGEGRYGEVLGKVITFVLDTQQPDGALSLVPPMQTGVPGNPSRSAHYNHAIAGLLLSEVYGMTPGRQVRPIREAIEEACRYAYRRLPQPKRDPIYEGGWRYRRYESVDDADLTVTSWHLMFLRSCRNAGFDVPVEIVDAALRHVEKLYRPELGTFVYAVREQNVTRALAGAAILSFSLTGRHEDERARQAGRFLLRYPFVEYNVRIFPTEHYFYSCFYASQAMFQLGGDYWRAFYPVLARTLTTHQRPDGSWDRDGHTYDGRLGQTYSTAMAVLALSPPYQCLPIFQR